MKHFLLSVDEINKLQMENEAYKQSEQEASEIIAELKAYKDVNEDFKTAWEELKAENERLKEEIGGMQILIDNYITHTEKYHQTLQEIKQIAEEWMKDYCYLDNFKDEEGCSICHENKDCYSYRLLKAITKAEEE